MGQVIMIVDDMKLNIDILAENLSDEYMIMPATSGLAAMKMLERKKPDLVLLDVFMPEVDGFDVLKFIKERESLAEIPVIFITGESDAEVEERGFLLGAADYVKKPFSPAVVKKKVKNQLMLKDYLNQISVLTKEKEKQTAAINAILMGIALMGEQGDEFAPEHINRVKEYTRILAVKTSELRPDIITGETAEKIAVFSPLHDIGKAFIPDEVKYKTEPYTEGEFELFKRHTVKGADLVKGIVNCNENWRDNGYLSIAIEIILYHHERFDGTGYPYGLKGAQIPISARITALAGACEALRREVGGEKPISFKEAYEIIVSGRTEPKAAYFDPEILAVLKEC